MLKTRNNNICLSLLHILFIIASGIKPNTLAKNVINFCRNIICKSFQAASIAEVILSIFIMDPKHGIVSSFNDQYSLRRQTGLNRLISDSHRGLSADLGSNEGIFDGIGLSEIFMPYVLVFLVVC